MDFNLARATDAVQEQRKRRPHHSCPGPNCNERDVSKWVNDGVFHATEATFSTVHKWKVMFEDEQTLTLPAGSKIVSVEEQNQGIVLYAVVTDSPKREDVKIYVHGTGHPLHPGVSLLNNIRFIGTVKMHGGSLMFHVFEGARTDA